MTDVLKLTFVHCQNRVFADTQMFGIHFMPVWAYTLAAHLARLPGINMALFDDRFDRIADAVLRGEVYAGVLIHEGRFTYEAQGLSKVTDLGTLWEEGIGIRWPALPNSVATTLTLIVVVTTLAVVAQRAMARDSRVLSRFQDYALPVLIAVPFLAGFLVMHPAWNPFSRDPTLLVHILSADVLIFLVPLTKLSHMILLPFTQFVSQLAWHFPPDAGQRVGVALGKENEPI